MATVREIMRTELVTASPEMSIRELAKLLTTKEISGVPVTDENGHVLGVVSMSDLTRLSAAEVDLEMPPLGQSGQRFSSELDGEDGEEGGTEPDVVDYFQQAQALPASLEVAELDTGNHLDEYNVRAIMTPANFHIHPDSDLQELAAFLTRGRIHRALVMEDDRLVGIVTTVDLMRAMAESA